MILSSSQKSFNRSFGAQLNVIYEELANFGGRRADVLLRDRLLCSRLTCVNISFNFRSLFSQFIVEWTKEKLFMSFLKSLLSSHSK